MKESPDDKGPSRSVPEPDEEERDENIQDYLRLWNPVPAKGKIDIITEEPAERHMPSAPEFLDGERFVGTVKVEWKLDIEEECSTKGHIGVAREIIVELQGV